MAGSSETRWTRPKSRPEKIEHEEAEETFQSNVWQKGRGHSGAGEERELGVLRFHASDPLKRA